MSFAVWLVVALVSKVNDNIRIGLTDSSLEPLESYSGLFLVSAPPRY